MRIITLPNGNRVSLRTYVAHWKLLKTFQLDELIVGWSHTATPAGWILSDIRKGVHDRINQRGGLVIRDVSAARINKLRAKHLTSECRWCGQPLGHYAEPHNRFCSGDCRRDYNH